MRRADGAIFLTRAAKAVVGSAIGSMPKRHTIIPHGIDSAFLKRPRTQAAIGAYSEANPFRWLYVSIVDVYKHQWNVVAAVARLRTLGLPVVLDLVGPAYPPAMRRLRKAMMEHDPRAEFVKYHGLLTGEELVRMYHGADALVFASTCENLPIILLEGMAAGLPIVCADHPVMREVLRDGGQYSDCENVVELALAMQEVMLQPARRSALAAQAFVLASEYRWTDTARATFAFLEEIARSATRPTDPRASAA
jgi:glycosyltransferase involved in cell wall biosynthesis